MADDFEWPALSTSGDVFGMDVDVNAGRSRRAASFGSAATEEALAGWDAPAAPLTRPPVALPRLQMAPSAANTRRGSVACSPQTVHGVETLTSIFRSTSLDDALAHLSTTHQFGFAAGSYKGVGDYIFQKDLGEGTTGKVRLAMHAVTRQVFAVKCINKAKMSAPASAERLLREVLFVKLLDHPNIARLYEVIDTPTELYMVLEYASGGELFDYIVHHQRVKEKEARRFFRQILSALQYCHANMVIHRDLKPENLLLDENLNIKIIDFGFANVMKPGRLLETFCGSPAYAAPEMMAGHKYAGAEVDIWSIGVILYALLAGYLPFDDDSPARMQKLIIEGKYTFPDFMSEGAKDLISRLLRVSPQERLTLEQVQQHPWVNEGYDELVPFFQPAAHAVDMPVVDDAALVRELAACGFSEAEVVAALAAPDEYPQVMHGVRLLQERAARAASCATGGHHPAAAHDQQSLELLGTSAGATGEYFGSNLVPSGSSSSLASTLSTSSLEYLDQSVDVPDASLGIQLGSSPSLTPGNEMRAPSTSPTFFFAPRNGGAAPPPPSSSAAWGASGGAGAAAMRSRGRRSKRGSDAGYPLGLGHEHNRLNTISETEAISFDELPPLPSSSMTTTTRSPPVTPLDAPTDVQQYLRTRGRRHSEQPSLGHAFPLLTNATRRRRSGASPAGPFLGPSSSTSTPAMSPATSTGTMSPAGASFGLQLPSHQLPSHQLPVFFSQPVLASQSEPRSLSAGGPFSGGIPSIDAGYVPGTSLSRSSTAPTTPSSPIPQTLMHQLQLQPPAHLFPHQLAHLASAPSASARIRPRRSLDAQSTNTLLAFQTMQGSHAPASLPAVAAAGAVRCTERGMFSVDTTSTKHPLEVVQEITRVLNALHFVFVNRPAFVFQVEAYESGELVRFEMEVCVVTQVGLTGIRTKRLYGNTWAYKTVHGAVLSHLQL